MMINKILKRKGYMSTNNLTGSNIVTSGNTLSGQPYHQQLGAAQYPVYTYGTGFFAPYQNPCYTAVLNIKVKQQEVEKSMTEYEKVKKEKEIIDSLHPTTIEILTLAYELSTSNNLDDVSKLDKLVRDMLFSSKLENQLTY